MKDMMQYKGYYGSVHFDADDLIFHGKIEFVRALISYEATDAKGLKRAFEESINDYLALCKKEHIEPELPFKGSLNVRLGPDLHRRIAIAALLQHTSINSFIAKTLEQAMH